MDLSELIASPLPEYALLIGGFLAILIAIMGRREGTYLDEIAVVLAFFVGLFMVALSVLSYLYGDQETSTLWVLGILGFSLFSRAFKKIKWAAIVALIIAGLLAYAIYVAAASFSLGFVTTEIILVIAFVVFIVLFLVLKAIESTVRFLGAVISFRPILLVGGMLAVIEAVLLFLDTSLSSLLG